MFTAYIHFMDQITGKIWRVTVSQYPTKDEAKKAIQKIYSQYTNCRHATPINWYIE